MVAKLSKLSGGAKRTHNAPLSTSQDSGSNPDNFVNLHFEKHMNNLIKSSVPNLR